MTTRISGLASGIDIDSMVKQLMSAERVPVDKLKQQQQLLSWQRDAYKDINSKILDFRNNKVMNFKLESNLGAKKATVTGNTDAVTVKALANAPSQPTSIKVMQLAQSTEFKSTAPITKNNSFDASKTLADQAVNLAEALPDVNNDGKITTDDKFTFKINGTEITVDPTTDTLNSVVSQINSKTNARAFYENGTLVLSSKDTGAKSSINVSDDTNHFIKNVLMIDAETEIIGKNSEFSAGSTLKSQANNLNGTLPGSDSFNFTINGTAISVDQTKDSLDAVIKKISGSTNVNASYENGKIIFRDKITGEPAAVTVTDDVNNFVTNILKYDQNETIQHGVDAKFSINGISTSRSSNSFVIDGLNITLNSVSQYNGTGTPSLNPDDYGPASTITATPDTDSIFNSIKSFISDYNSLLKMINGKITEDKYRDYAPLTDEQKESMKDDDITNWQLKAQSGLLRSDTTLTKAFNNMRMDMQAIINTGSSSIRSLADIGIGSNSYSDNGQLTIKDEAKLREAIESDPDAIMALFSAKGDDNGKGAGVATRLYSDLLGTLKDISSKAGTSIYGATDTLDDESVLGKQLTKLKSTIKDKNNMLTDRETAYYNKFTAMETAIQSYNQQSAYISNFTSS